MVIDVMLENYIQNVNIMKIKLLFKHIRENISEVNRYILDCTRLVVHTYIGFTWYNFCEIVIGCLCNFVSNFGDRTLSTAGSLLWNSLLCDVTNFRSKRLSKLSTATTPETFSV